MYKIIAVLLVIFYSNSFAQNQEQKKHMEKLSSLIGKWETISTEKDREGNWITNKPSTSEINSFFDGTFIEEKAKILGNGYEMNLRTTFGYMPRNGKYRLSVLDKEYAVFDIYEGNFEGDNLVVDNLASSTPFVTKDGTQYNFKLIYKLAEKDNHELVVLITADEGKTWNDYQKVAYKRIK